MKSIPALLLLLTVISGSAQTTQTPSPLRTAADGPFTPELIVPGGRLLPLFPPDSRLLKKERLKEPEQYNPQTGGKRPITNVINIHNPSIEVHLVPPGQPNTGSAVIVVLGGGHKILWVGPEGADYVPYFAQAGVSTIILRNRLRIDGYDASIDAVNDAFQAIRLVRFHAAAWKIDPAKIGMVGFSAGAELAAPAALFFDEFTKQHSEEGDPLAKVSPRPDFVGIIYPGPTLLPKPPTPRSPPTCPTAFSPAPAPGTASTLSGPPTTSPPC